MEIESGHLQQVIQQAMAQDYSWDRSAEAYVAAYHRAMANKAVL